MFGFLALLLSRVVFLGPTSIGQSGNGLVGYTSWLDGVQNPSWKKTLGSVFVGRRSRIKAFTALSGSLILLLPTGVLAQEVAPAKLIMYLQRFRPQDYQRLLEVHSSREKPQGTKDADSSLD